jgi:uncharacterized phage-associated protein
MTDSYRSVPADIVANQLLWIRREIETTPMHIIKLTYLAHGWMLGLHERPLINEPVEAWTYGPVVPSLYHKYKSFGGDSIDVVPIDMSDKLDKEQSNIIEIVNDVYIDYTALDLSSHTHETGSPWHQAILSSGPGCIIPNKIIQKYYTDMAMES